MYIPWSQGRGEPLLDKGEVMGSSINFMQIKKDGSSGPQTNSYTKCRVEYGFLSLRSSGTPAQLP